MKYLVTTIALLASTASFADTVKIGIFGADGKKIKGANHYHTLEYKNTSSKLHCGFHNPHIVDAVKKYAKDSIKNRGLRNSIKIHVRDREVAKLYAGGTNWWNYVGPVTIEGCTAD